MHHLGMRVYLTAIVMCVSSFIARVQYGARGVRTAQDGIRGR